MQRFRRGKMGNRVISWHVWRTGEDDDAVVIKDTLASWAAENYVQYALEKPPGGGESVAISVRPVAWPETPVQRFVVQGTAVVEYTAIPDLADKA